MSVQFLFNHGAYAVVDVPARQILSRSGKVTSTTYGTFTDNWFSYNRGIGRFEAHSALEIAKDGAFQSTRTNFWNNGGATDRGFLSVEAGGEITKANPAAETDHIRASPPSGNAFTIQNTGVTVFRGCGQNAGTSGTNSMIISCWVRKSDHSVVTTSDVRIHCGTASGDWVDGNNRAGATLYEPLRDGWTRISAIVPTDGATTTVAQGIKLAPGLTLTVEFGQHERFITGTPGPTDPIPTDVAGNTDRVRGSVSLDINLRGVQGHAQHLKAGAIAVACSPDRDAIDQTFGQIVQYGIPDTNHGIVLSDSTDRIAGWTRIATVSTAFIDADDLSTFNKHTPIGACFQWGTRGPSTGDYFFAANGLKEGLVTTTTDLPSLSSARFAIGSRLDSSDVISSAADSRILYVAFFDRKPGRANCMLISKWMQDRARDFWEWS